MPVGAIADVAVAALDAGVALVTDVGSVKGPIVDEVDAAAARRRRRASSAATRWPVPNRTASTAARADLFVGATWVLTPTRRPTTTAYATLRALLRELHAEVVAVTPDDHDVLVAFVSHVPQLAASTLMDVATAHEEEHRALLRLAAGGFRDMTRIAASHPTIWLDILTSNRDAVLGALDAYLDALARTRATSSPRVIATRSPTLLGRARAAAAQPAGRRGRRDRSRRAARPGARPPGRASPRSRRSRAGSA